MEIGQLGTQGGKGKVADHRIERTETAHGKLVNQQRRQNGRLGRGWIRAVVSMKSGWV